MEVTAEGGQTSEYLKNQDKPLQTFIDLYRPLLEYMRQWCTMKKIKANMTNLVRVRLTDVELTDIEQIDELPGL